MSKSANKNELNMTEGNLFKKMLAFALPLMLSGVLQLLYNATDLIVCGKFGSEHSVGAIASTNALINLIINLILGLSVGSNVLMARCFGSNQQEKGQRVVYTAMIMAVVLGVAVGAFGAIFSRYFLVWMGSTEDVIDLSTQYLLIYFLGSPFSLLYNFGSSILRATGDTRRPFYFLAVSGLFNVGFNLLFIIVCRMDVAGVALGTILSQAISAGCIVVCMLKNKGFFHFDFKEMKFYKEEAKEIVKIGLPAGIQGTIVSMSNVLIQSSINSLGTAAVDGSGAAASIEGFVYVSMNAFAQTCTAFISANFGANKWKNIKRCLCYGVVYTTIFGLIIGATATLLGKQLLGIYLSSAEPIELGYTRLIVIALSYFTCGIMEVIAFSLRGIGHSTLPMIVSLCGMCGFRVVWIYTFFQMEVLHTLQGVALSYPISWVLTSAVHLLCFVLLYKKEQAASQTEQNFSQNQA